MEQVESAEHGATRGFPGNIFLVGMMGAGKTSVGRLLAKRLGKSFQDSDHLIEAQTGVRIATIFELEGEEGFRARESAALAQLCTLPDVVLATGGGAILRECNREVLHAHGTVVYLRAGVNDLWARTRQDRNRPLLQTADPLGRLTELHTMRDPLYEQTAHLVIDTGSQTLKTLVARLEERLLQLAEQQAA